MSLSASDTPLSGSSTGSSAGQPGKPAVTLSLSKSLIYLYVGAEWSGPFQIEQIRFFRHHGQVESDTYAYDPDHQRHYTVGELLAVADARGGTHLEGTGNALAAPSLDESSTPSTTRIFFAADESDPTATIGTSLDALPDPLRTFLRIFRELTENDPADRGQAQANLAEMASAIGIQLSAAIVDTVTLQALTEDVLRLADYLANRLQDGDLWEAIDALRLFKPETDAEETAAAARSVITCLVARAARGHAGRATPGLVPVVRDLIRDHTRDVTPSLTDSQEIKAITDSWDQPHARTARIILRDARKELKSTEADLEAIHQAYAQLQDAHGRDLTEAREMLARLETARADEVANAAQALAEVRSLAAEIHRLADETLSGEDDLKGEIRQLADELKGQDATAMAPLAEALLIRLVARLRNLAAEPGVMQMPGEVGLLREELAKVRGELVGARAQVLVLTDERDRLKRQLDDQRAAADRAIANAKEREQRLRSTVTALEVTKDLHQDVMRELEVQLTTAQKRVGEMEGELSNVRGELTHTRTHLADRTEELQSEMRRAVELQALLEARRVELSHNLKDAEAQLQQAQAEQAVSGTEGDPELMEALAAKVNHLRTMFEATKRRLDEQQQLSVKLEDELSSSRREASELRGRSDALTGELDEARVGLAAAKKRFEELNRAYTRLDSERESLQQELTQRKGTDAVRKESGPIERPTELARNDQSLAQSGTSRMNKVLEALEARLADTQRKFEQANAMLESERRRVQELTLSHSQLQVRVDDLTADRDHLRVELDRLHADHFSEHSRHSASIAVATQSSIDAERRLKDAIARQVELEDQVSYLQQHQVPAETALQQLSADGEDSPSGVFVSPAHVAKLTRELEDARAEVERLQTQQAGSASGQRHALHVRLAQVEAELSTAASARDDAVAALQATVAERERLGRELSRLRGEHESAAVEHRASLKAARDKLGESQARVQVLEKELEQLRALPVAPDPHIAERAADRSAERISDLIAERDRLAEQVRELTLGIARAGVTDELPIVRRQLDQELERIKALTRSLAEAQTQGDQIRSRVSELEGRSTNAQHERDQLQIEIERLKGELLMAQAHAGVARESDQGRRSHIEAKLHEVLADREQLLGELSRVNAELMQVRGRLVRAESQAITAERLPVEYGRVRDLELALTQLRAEQQTTSSELDQIRSKLSQTTSERDHLQGEVTRLRAQLDTMTSSGTGTHLVDELVQLRDKLTRAKMRIRALRKERDDLLAKSGQSFSGGANDGTPTPFGSGSSGTGSGSRADVALEPKTALEPSAQHERNRLLGLPPTRNPLTGRILMSGELPGASGFTSVFGRPAIPASPSSTGHSGIRPVLSAGPTAVQILVPTNAYSPSLATDAAPNPGPRSGWSPRSRWATAAGLMVVGVGLTALALRPPVRDGEIVASLLRLSTPIGGVVDLTVEVGQRVPTGTQIAIIHDELVDRGGWTGIEAKRQALAARSAAISEELRLLSTLPTAEIGTEPDALQQGRLDRLNALEREASALAEQIQERASAAAAELTRINELSRARVVVDKPAIVRRVYVAQGQRVMRGSDLAEAVEQDSLAVTLSLPTSGSVPLTIGQAMLVEVPGHRTLLDGQVESYALSADGSRFIARISVPGIAGDLAAIGQPVRVVILRDRSTDRWLGSLFTW